MMEAAAGEGIAIEVASGFRHIRSSAAHLEREGAWRASSASRGWSHRRHA